jgi:hypothetical protein
MHIGLDFDNTIIRYDDVFVAAAKERGLVPGSFRGSKQQVRDAIRLIEDGENAWQKLQGHVYGAGIGGASLFEGLDDFLRSAKARGDLISIVSHKTEYGHYDPLRVNLREAALGWMETQGFFDPEGFGLSYESVHFGATREEKLEGIRSSGVDIFIDDLEEVLDEPGFPAGVRKVLFSQHPVGNKPYPVYTSWADISEAMFVDA